MALSMTKIAFGAVVVTGALLYTIGPPGGRGSLPRAATTAVTAEERPAASTVESSGVTLHSVSFDWPLSDRSFPGGVEANAINNNCLACHSAGMVLNQPKLSRAAWEGEVEKMRETYKAPVATSDIPAIVEYLATTKGWS
jgi:hypothetical protein